VTASGMIGVEAPVLRLTRPCGSASQPMERAVEAKPNMMPLRSGWVILESQVFKTGSSPAEQKIIRKRSGSRQSTA